MKAAVNSALRLADSKQRPKPETIELLGEGWTAEQALSIPIYCSLKATSFSEGVLLAVNHSGDSDSTGSMTGNLLGALLGARALPLPWIDQLEMRHEIERISRDVARIKISGTNLEQDRQAYPGGQHRSWLCTINSGRRSFPSAG